MHVNLVRIGNSQGIRIPKPLVDELGLIDALALEPDGDAEALGLTLALGDAEALGETEGE